MLDHLGLNVPDLGAAKTYYDALMPFLGFEPFFATEEEFSYKPAGGKPGTFVFFYVAPEKNRYVRKQVGLQHVAFRARTRPQVDDAHAQAIALGSEILHAPKLFPQYHDNYYASFWFDPHGFLLEICCNKPVG
ncbi:MAG TPA: VOC family protein [Actinomycetota bacterium]|nr:VOC family protein [Actinomycetota bacterium]